MGGAGVAGGLPGAAGRGARGAERGARGAGRGAGQERKEFGADWYRFLPEQREEWLAEQRVEAGETQTAFDHALVRPRAHPPAGRPAGPPTR